MVGQKAVNEITVVYLSFALFPVMDPVSAGILDVWRQRGIDGLLVDFGPERSGQTQAADVSLQVISSRQQLEAAVCQLLMGVLLHNPERVRIAIFVVNE